MQTPLSDGPAKELAHLVMEAEDSQDLQFVN